MQDTSKHQASDLGGVLDSQYSNVSVDQNQTERALNQDLDMQMQFPVPKIGVVDLKQSRNVKYVHQI